MPKKRNILSLFPSERYVVKTYLSGTIKERLTRMAQETDGLISSRGQTHLAIIPKVIDMRLDNSPSLIIEYLPHRCSLFDAIQQDSIEIYSSHIESIFAAIDDIHKATISSQGPPIEVLEMARKYGERHPYYFGSDNISFLCQKLAELPNSRRSKIHGDFKIANILIRDIEPHIILDFEHYSEGPSEYDFATFFANALLFLTCAQRETGIKNVLHYINAFIENEIQFLLFIAVRLLVEYGPAIDRGEYGETVRCGDVLKWLFQYTIENIASKSGLVNFVEDLGFNQATNV